MFKFLILLCLTAYASAGAGLYTGLGNYYGNGYGYGYGGYGHSGSIVSYAPTLSYAPYATSYANTIKYPSGLYAGGLYPYAKKIIYANPLNKLGYYSPTYLGGYAASYAPSYYGYGSGYGYGSNGYYDYGLGGHGYGGYLGGVSAYGHNIYNHY